MKNYSFKFTLSRLLPKGSTSLNATLVVFGDGITFTSALIASMILARIITIDAMATYRQVLYLGTLAQSIVEFGLSASIYRFWNLLDEKGRSTYIKMQLKLAIILGGFASIILALLAPYLAIWYHNPDLKVAMLIACASPLVNIVPLTIRPVMICKGKPLLATLTTLLFSLAMVFAIIIPFYFTSNLNIALTAWMIVNLIEVFLTFLILSPELIRSTPGWNKKLFVETWNYLWPIQAGRIPGIAATYTDKIATSALLSTQAFAAYSLGARELPFIGKIGPSISSVLIPRLVTDVEAGNLSDVCRLWKSACEKTSLIIYPIIGFSIWFSVPIVRFLYSAKYTESYIPFAVFAAITYLRVIEYASLAKAFNKTNLILKSSAGSAVIMIIFSFPMTKWFGVLGISLAVLFSQVYSVGYLLLAYRKMLKVKLAEFYPWKKLLILIMISMICASSVGLIFEPVFHIASSTSMLNTGLKLAALFFFNVILYFLALIVFRIINIFQIIELFRKSENAQ